MRKLSEIPPSEPISVRTLVSSIFGREDYTMAEYKKIIKTLHILNEKTPFLFRSGKKRSKIWTTLAALKKTELNFYFGQSDLVFENIELKQKVYALESELNKLRNLIRK